jgi:hypothetical protein
MEAAYEKAGMKLTHLIGPKTGHSIHPDVAKEIEARLAEWAAVPFEKRAALQHVEFVTYSLLYPVFESGWIDRLYEHWEPAQITQQIDSNGALVITTSNIMAFSIISPLRGWNRDRQRVIIDGQQFKLDLQPTSPPWTQFARSNNAWSPVNPKQSASIIDGKKNRQTCGPIDHAFMDSFIFVKPSRQCAHPAVQQWVDAEMNRAITQWRRQFRGDARVKLDTEVTEEDVKTANLVLWGDRKSNAWIEKVADRLPITWDDSAIAVDKQKFDAENHALIAIYPNPLNASRYIVLNSGFTYREYDYLNNARQTPKLPDWAVVDLSTPPNSRWPGKIVAADFFDEEWRLKPTK